MDNTFDNHPKKSEEQLKHDDALKFKILIAFGSYILLTSFFFDSPRAIFEGLKIIMISPSALITDYFELVGVGASLANAAIMMFLSILLVKVSGARVTGVVMAGTILVAAFSLFGKNPYNAMSIVFGVFLYSKIVKQPFRNFIIPALFGTCLGPLVSEISFNMGLGSIRGIVLGKMLGILMGALVAYLSPKCISLHKGFILYNVGFTAGIISTVIITLMRIFGLEFFAEPHSPSGYNEKMSVVLIVLFFGMFLFGLSQNGWSMRGYKKLLSIPGKAGTDFTETSGIGLSLINMAFLGMLTMGYILAVGGQLSGPSIGGVFSVMGFGASGKHLKNVIPIMLGVYLMAMFGNFDVTQTGMIFAATFGTALSPISGTYGPLVGILTGALHLNLVVHTGNLHAGMNLYNNGFSAGILATILVPLFDLFNRWTRRFQRRDNRIS